MITVHRGSPFTGTLAATTSGPASTYPVNLRLRVTAAIAKESYSGTVQHRSRRARMAEILHRDGPECVWCRRPIDVGLVSATTEHVVPRIKGGPSWIENEVAACARCNHERGHRTPGDWLDECVQRGWHPNRDVLIRTLEALNVAIAERGGQRRARPYVAAQLRRLRGSGTRDHR